MTPLGLVVGVAMGWGVIPTGVHFSSTVLADESGLVTLDPLVHSSTSSAIHAMRMLGGRPTMAGDLPAATHYGVIGRVMRAMQDEVLLRVLVRNRIACGRWQRPHPLVIVLLVVQGLRVHQVGSYT